MSPVGKGLYLGQQASVIFVLFTVLLCQLCTIQMLLEVHCQY